MAHVRERAPLFAGTPWNLLVALATAVVASAWLVESGVLPRDALAITGVTAGYGSLLGTALAWAGVSRRTIVGTVGLLAVGAVAAHAHPIGALAYLGPPAVIVHLTTTGRLHRLGLGTPCPALAVGIGTCAGLFLALHVLVSATLTFGYRVRADLDVLAPAVLYDAGAQVLSTELFFRGALFNRAQRRWSLGVATLLATTAVLARYLVDPLLPHSVEMVLGMVFYLSILGITTCWLLWRFGTLVPGLAMSMLFFAAYRALVAQ